MTGSVNANAMTLARGSFICGGLAAGAACVASAADADLVTIAALSPADRRSLERFARARHVATTSLATVSGSAPARSDVFGERTDEVASPFVYEAASLSKPVFALGVLALVATGRLRLDEPIASLVDLARETSDRRVSRITPRHALSHTTGLPNWRFEPQPLRCAFEPGSRFSYSGEGIFLLQRAVERLTGRGIASFLREYVLDPLGMKSSTFAFAPHLGRRMLVPHDATGRPLEPRTARLGHQLSALAATRGVPLERWTWVDVRAALPTLDPPQRALPVFSTINAATSLLTTARDYARVVAAVSQHRALTVEQVRVTRDIAWGLGIGLERTSRTAFHWGDNDGFKAMMVASGTQPSGGVVLTDGDGGMAVAVRALERIVGSRHPALRYVAAKYA